MFRAQQNHFDDAVGKLHQSLLRQMDMRPWSWLAWGEALWSTLNLPVRCVY